MIKTIEQHLNESNHDNVFPIINEKEAFKWFKIAAEKGFAAAQSNLGSLYFYGEGVSKNYEKAFEWFKKAAEQGYYLGQHNLAVAYSNGRGVARNFKKAKDLFQKSYEYLLEVFLQHCC